MASVVSVVEALRSYFSVFPDEVQYASAYLERLPPGQAVDFAPRVCGEIVLFFATRDEVLLALGTLALRGPTPAIPFLVYAVERNPVIRSIMHACSHDNMRGDLHPVMSPSFDKRMRSAVLIPPAVMWAVLASTSAAG